jgi:hypothetical protein
MIKVQASAKTDHAAVNVQSQDHSGRVERALR